MTTLEELQYLLNISVAHVRQQGGPSGHITTQDGGKEVFHCMYRNKDGKQCAAGPFIKSYDGRLEGFAWSRAAEYASRMGHVKLDPIAAKHANFVHSVLQAAHDAAVTPTAARGGPFMGLYEENLANHVEYWKALHPEAKGLVIPPVQS